MVILTFGQASAQPTLKEALDGPALEWTAGGQAAWLGVLSAAAHAGPSVAELRLLNSPNAPPYGPWLGCTRSWLETTVTGPGVFSIWMRHNNNPYVAIHVSLDGTVRESVRIYGYEPDKAWSAWHRISLPLGPGPHAVRLDHSFYCDGNQGTMMVVNPTVQLDDAGIAPSLADDFLAALEIQPGSTGWLAGGDGTHSIVQAESHDGVDAIKFTPAEDDFVLYELSPPWIEKTFQGPITVSWWSRHPSSQPAVVPDGEWTRHYRFIPDGVETVRWSSPLPLLLDEISVGASPEISLPEALDAEGRVFQQSGSAWKGVQSPAAPDGIDAAWCRPLTDAGEVLETTVQGPAQVEFSYQTINAGLKFQINGREVALPVSTGTWLLPPGSHSLRWTGMKSYQNNPGRLVYLDKVKIQSLTVLTLAEALDGGGLVWTTGPIPWTGLATALAHDGQDAASAPPLQEGELAWVETSATGPGVLTFQWTPAALASTSTMPTFAELVVDGRHRFPLSNNMSAPMIEVGPGNHTFRWQVTGAATLRSALLDQVQWTVMPQNGPLLTSLDDVAGPFFTGNAALISQPPPAESHDATDAVKLSPSHTETTPDQSFSVAVEGPGTFSYWAKSTVSATLYVDQLPANTAGTKNNWNNHLQFIPPGARVLTFTAIRDHMSPAVPAAVWLDGMSLLPLQNLTLPDALGFLRPWSTHPDSPWVGLPGSPGFPATAAHAPAATVANPSWLETTVDGPAVISFSVRGTALAWSVGGASPIQNVNGAATPAPAATYIPPGRHTVRWSSTGSVASLGNVRLHPMPTTVSLRDAGDFLELTVPRPEGIPDGNIKIQFLAAGNFWYQDYSAGILSTDAAKVVFRVSKPSASSRIYRTVFSPP